MALSNAWGTFLIIFLMGYGLVEIPKYLINLTDFKNRIKYLEWKTKLNIDYINIRTGEFIQLIKQLETIESIPLLAKANITENENDCENGIINSENYYRFLNFDDYELDNMLSGYKSKFNYESLIDISCALKFNKNEIIKLSSEIAAIYSEWFTLNYLYDENITLNVNENRGRSMSFDYTGKTNTNLKNINNIIITNYNNNKVGFEKYYYNDSLPQNLNTSNISYKSEYSFLRDNSNEKTSLDRISKNYFKP